MGCFFDLQVNGHAGVDYSSPELNDEKLMSSVEQLKEKGTKLFLPTVITSPTSVYKKVLPILAGGCEKSNAPVGIHLEGPFISSEEGAVGTHPKDHVVPPSIETFKRLQDAARGHIRLVTLAPELPGTTALIEYLIENGVQVAVGHTMAKSSDIANACQAGAKLATHLGNGIPAMLNRTDNPIWAILASPLTVSLISDGVHLPEDFVRIVWKLKGAKRVILVSDASPLAGCKPGRYDIWGTSVSLDSNGCIRNLKTRTLAGSAKTMNECAEIFKSLCSPSSDELQMITHDNVIKLLNE